MKNATLFILTLTLFAGVTTAQSGRKVAAAPLATPAVADQNDPSQYSESKPHSPRTYRSRPRPESKEAVQAIATPSVSSNSTSTDDADVVRVETNLVTIPVSVFDRNGLY